MNNELLETTEAGAGNAGGRPGRPLQCLFIIEAGAGLPCVNVSTMPKRTPKAGTFSICTASVMTSDRSVPFQFDIKKNGTSIFKGMKPTIGAGTPDGQMHTFTGLTSVPLPVSEGDIITLDILQGSASWHVAVQLEK